MIASDVSFDVTKIGGIAVVRPGGKLDMSSYAGFRDGLLKVAGDEPAALVVRLDGDFSVASPSMLAVFATVWMRVSEWPGVPLAVVAETTKHCHDLRHSGVTRFIGAHSNLRSAIQAVDRPPPRRRDTLSLACSPSAPLAARAFVRATCEHWGVPWVAEDAVLIVSELVENAVRHAASQPVVRLEHRTDILSVAVHDQDDKPPVRLHNGHGLDIVDRVSRAWGWCPSFDGGKAVWAVLSLP